MAFEIIKDAGAAPQRTGGFPSQYPFAKMDVGDAFDAPRDMGSTKLGSDKRRASVAGCASSWARSHNSKVKFVTRLIDEHTVRCWRIA